MARVGELADPVDLGSTAIIAYVFKSRLGQIFSESYPNW